MVMRGLASASMALRRSQQLKHLFFNPLIHNSFLHVPSLCDVVCKVHGSEQGNRPHYWNGFGKTPMLEGFLNVHSSRFLSTVVKGVEEKGGENAGNDGSGELKPKRKKLKGKRAVVKWLKCFRYKKKKEDERRTPEEKILFKLTKARKKEKTLVDALMKIVPKGKSETSHDPEILTPEEHFYYLKMGEKSKNYVPIGRRGVYQGVILNMHLHWKKHQTLQVIVKTFLPEEVKEIAAELARLSGGIVLDIQDDETIIMYRGKNYSQPPTEIMSPRCSLPRKKALDKSKYRDALRAVRKYIPRLELDLKLLRAQAESKTIDSEDKQSTNTDDFEGSEKLKELLAKSREYSEDDDPELESGVGSDSENLSDMFETDSDGENENKEERPLYLDEFEKFPVQNNDEMENFEEHLLQISAESRNEKNLGENAELPELDEVDRMVLQGASFLKEKRR